MHEKLARKARIAEIEREMSEASISQGTSFLSIAAVDSFTEAKVCMDKSETVENGHKSIIPVSVHSTPENAVKLVHEGKFSAPRRDSKTPTEADERTDWKDRCKADDGACSKGATSQPEVSLAIKGTSKLHTAECIQNWSETFGIADNGRQNFRSETLLVDIKQILEEEIHFVMSEHSIVQTEENLNDIMTEMRQAHGSLAIASSKRTSEELSGQFELLQESSEFSIVLQPVQQRKLSRLSFMPIIHSLNKETSVLNLLKITNLSLSNILHCKTIGMKTPRMKSYTTLQ